MLLKKPLNFFVLKKNLGKDVRPANTPALDRKGRLGFFAYAAVVL